MRIRILVAMSGGKNRFYPILTTLGLIVFLLLYHNLQTEKRDSIRVMFYNVENLFDTEDDPQKQDNAFLPRGAMRWTEPRYFKKLNNVARVVTAVGEGEVPSLIGLCEVESAKVLDDLLSETGLSGYGYRYSITNSPDHRGINVSLLYRPEYFEIVDTAKYSPSFSSQEYSTRDILHVAGKVGNDTLDVFVCHFPSRNAGLHEAVGYRAVCALLLKIKTDSIMRQRKRPNVLVMGDFNDYPDDKSLLHVLEAKSEEGDLSDLQLYNLFYHNRQNQAFASYKYKERWGAFDQFIVNGRLLNRENSLSINEKGAMAYRDSLMLEVDWVNGGDKPYRTYSGIKYKGGVSDHLPIYMDLNIKSEK